MSQPVPVPDPIWPDRWQALRQIIDHSVKGISQDTTLKDSPYHQLLSALRTFADHWFTYFYTGFRGDPSVVLTDLSPNPVPQLDIDYEYLPDFVMRTITNRVAGDFELIQRAYQQRAYGSTDQIQTLNLVDAWAVDLLKQFGDPPGAGFPSLLSTIPRVISYFNTSAETRLIPYAQAVFVGIPHTAALPATRRELLVVPHELGHYVYCLGKLDNVPVCDILDDFVEKKETFIQKWVEELFCDVFATAATPHRAAMVRWALSMIRDNPTSTYWSDSDSHPVDVIRMFTYLIPAALGLLFMSELDEEHAINTGRKGGGWYRTRNEEGEEQKYTIQQLKVILEPVLTGIAEKLGLPQFSTAIEQIREKLWKDSRRVMQALAEAGVRPEITAQFPGHLLETLRPARIVDDVFEKYAWYKSFEDELEGYTGEVSQTGFESWLLRADSSPIVTPSALDSLTFDTQSLSCKAWHAILFRCDWITKGPQTGPPVGAWEDVEPDN